MKIPGWKLMIEALYSLRTCIQTVDSTEDNKNHVNHNVSYASEGKRLVINLTNPCLTLLTLGWECSDSNCISTASNIITLYYYRRVFCRVTLLYIVNRISSGLTVFRQDFIKSMPSSENPLFWFGDIIVCHVDDPEDFQSLRILEFRKFGSYHLLFHEAIEVLTCSFNGLL